MISILVSAGQGPTNSALDGTWRSEPGNGEPSESFMGCYWVFVLRLFWMGKIGKGRDDRLLLLMPLE